MFRLVLAGVLMFCSLIAMAATDEVRFETRDGIAVLGDLYRSADGRAAPIILLFHQAGGDAQGEYAEIASRLVDSGYNVLAIDQRSGGDRFGGINRTLQALGGEKFGYCDVYPDLEAALEFVRADGFDGPLAVWGSSYSAALVFQLGAKKSEEISAILAFSPASGAPLANCDAQQFIDDLSAPVLALRPRKEFEIDSVRQQMNRFEESGIRTYVSDPGVHGSSMLVDERVGAPTEETWTVVLEFLRESLGD
ncbi:MAG: lysophospholipase [Gammaproteobacteria bacterium]|nr:lysophospholipase [Gammaproteobacteria bacterium]